MRFDCQLLFRSKYLIGNRWANNHRKKMPIDFIIYEIFLLEIGHTAWIHIFIRPAINSAFLGWVMKKSVSCVVDELFVWTKLLYGITRLRLCIREYAGMWATRSNKFTVLELHAKRPFILSYSGKMVCLSTPVWSPGTSYAIRSVAMRMRRRKLKYLHNYYV